MGIFAKKRISAEDGRVTVAGDVTLAELREAVPARALCVEPLSRNQPLTSFLAEGGLGFGSRGHGTFAGQLLKVQGTYSDRNGEVGFSYGLGRAPLYNVGFPLQRIMEGKAPSLLDGRFAPPSEMVLRTRERRPLAIDHSPADGPDLPGAEDADDVMFVNAAAAKVMGLPGAGIVRTRADGDAGADAWARRFVLDKLPEHFGRLLVLTQPSGARALFEAHAAKGTEGVFIALAVHLGVLVGVSARPGHVNELAERAADLPLTWRLG